MMICDADFRELFPHLFDPEHAPDAPGMAGRAAADSLAMGDVPIDGAARQMRGDQGWPDPMNAGLAYAAIPAAAAYGAALSLLTTYGRMAEAWEAPAPTDAASCPEPA